MRRAGLLPTRAMLRSLVVQARFRLFGFDEMQIRDAVRGAGDMIAGVDSDHLMRFAERVVPVHVVPRVYTEARDRIHNHCRTQLAAAGSPTIQTTRTVPPQALLGRTAGQRPA